MARFLQIVSGILLSMMSVGCCYSHRYYDPMTGAMYEKRIGGCFSDRDDWNQTPQQGYAGPGNCGGNCGCGSWDNAGMTEWSQPGYGSIVPTYDPGVGEPQQQATPMPMPMPMPTTPNAGNGIAEPQPAPPAENGVTPSASYAPQPPTYYPVAIPPGIARRQWRARPVVAH